MKKFSILLFALAFLFLAGLFWWQFGTKPVNPKDSNTKIFVIQKGEGLKSIAKRLKSEGLIRDQIAFFILVRVLNFNDKIQAGDFRLSPSMDAQTLAKELTLGTLDVWVTIPEGLRSEEVTQILKDKVSTFKPDWVFELKKNEGYLFPDTYLFPKDADIKLIIEIMRGNFQGKWQEIEKTDQVNFDESRSLSEIVILASLVEREAKFSEDRPKVASVLLNRLKRDMPLQVDATVQYAIGKIDNSWWKKNLTRDDLKINSPFNTYIKYGLPPAAISNPGLEALKAAAFPAKTDYFYYLSSKDGRMHYAENFEEHNQNIQKYL